jgi:hypothetical protein
LIEEEGGEEGREEEPPEGEGERGRMRIRGCCIYAVGRTNYKEREVKI